MGVPTLPTWPRCARLYRRAPTLNSRKRCTDGRHPPGYVPLPSLAANRTQSAEIHNKIELREER